MSAASWDTVSLQLRLSFCPFSASAGNGDDIALRWGEVIPFWFMRSRLESFQSRAIILTQPQRRFVVARTSLLRAELSHLRRGTDTVSMLGELQATGRALFDFLHGLKETVVFVVSSDLAHTHRVSAFYANAITLKSLLLYPAAVLRVSRRLTARMGFPPPPSRSTRPAANGQPPSIRMCEFRRWLPLLTSPNFVSCSRCWSRRRVWSRTRCPAATQVWRLSRSCPISHEHFRKSPV